ncbi:MAG: adenylate kinase [Bacteroidota bacterium]|nr:adenylate kinase [Bacteroidota bacterium]
MSYLILFGPPGAGKGTQSQRIIQHFNLLHLATGDLLRSEIMNQTELGIQAKLYMDKGELVPDELVIKMLQSKLEELHKKNGVVFDGFPRTIAQAKALDKMLESQNQEISALVALTVPNDELLRRLSSRGLTSGRTDDASLVTIEHRLNIYHKKTIPVIEHYREQGKYFPIEGVGKIDDISNLLIETIEPLMSGK